MRAPRTAESKASRSSRVIRQSEAERWRIACRTGGRVQDFLGKIVNQQSKNEVSEEPTGLQPGQLSAHPGDARGGRAMVADDTAQQVGEDRRPGRSPWPFGDLPNGGGRGAAMSGSAGSGRHCRAAPLAAGAVLRIAAVSPNPCYRQARCAWKAVSAAQAGQAAGIAPQRSLATSIRRIFRCLLRPTVVVSGVPGVVNAA